MNPLAHVAVSCGTVWVGAQAIERAAGGAPSVRRVIEAVDYRLVLIGALVPDVIDKPIGWLIFRDYFDSNGHLYGHTLLAALLAIVPGVLLVARRRDPRLLAVGIGMLAHLAVDPVNHAPQNFFWPLLGNEFDHVRFLNWWQTIITESAALLLFGWVALRLHRQDRLFGFIWDGRLPGPRGSAGADG